ncbi:DNA cytosine methyltransferase [Methylorubrum suomiense]|uniref:DNA cytosine methyltransferase n=1 Tax=Methylorubrum suomiense TaxID=144191 RepID=UPI001EE22934|nr:DNA cytosine methyltransferase [Methylorubrum suomiense]
MPVASTLVSGGHSNNPLDENLIAFSCKDHGADATDAGATPTLRAMGFDRSHANAGGQLAVAFGISCDAFDRSGEGARGTAAERSGLGIIEGISPTLKAKRPNGVASGWVVRRLTPRECERLQGFPDDYTLVPWRGGLLPDGPRYKALGNSMAANVMRWISHRIQMVEGLPLLTEVAA